MTWKESRANRLGAHRGDPDARAKLFHERLEKAYPAAFAAARERGELRARLRAEGIILTD